MFWLGLLSPTALLAVTLVDSGLKLVSWHESSVVLQSFTWLPPETLYTVYFVAKTDASQDKMADAVLPLYFTLCGAQGSARYTNTELLIT